MVKGMFGLGVVMLILGWWVARDFFAFKKSSLRAAAMVEQILPATLTLKYVHAGKEYRPSVNTIDKNWTSLKKGDTVRLVLLSSNPARFMPETSLADPGTVGWLRFLFFMAGMLLIGFSQVLRGRV